MLLGEVCRLKPETRQLDLCCGKGEMLCQWSQRWGIEGIGVDISKVFLAAAHERAAELSVTDRVSFVEADAGKYVAEAQGFDVVSCIGATWIGDGLVGTLKLMLPALKPGGLLLVGGAVLDRDTAGGGLRCARREQGRVCHVDGHAGADSQHGSGTGRDGAGEPG